MSVDHGAAISVRSLSLWEREQTELAARVQQASCCSHLNRRYPPMRGIFASTITFFHLAMSALM
jgi:hypothetical protein